MVPQFTMPRDMSGYSELEGALLAAIHTADLPEPVAEYRFDWCCGHHERDHSESQEVDLDGRPTSKPYGYCIACVEIDAFRSAHEYHHGRKWAFDFAWPALKLAAECDGGTYSGGRHTTGTGFERDAEKYAAATVQGWVVLRLTQKQITSGAALDSLAAVIARLSNTEGVH